MISIKKAKEICQNEYAEYPVDEIVDIGKKWAFCFDAGDPPAPGVPIIVIDKEDGKVDYMTIPPLENLDLLEGGTVIEKAK